MIAGAAVGIPKADLAEVADLAADAVAEETAELSCDPTEDLADSILEEALATADETLLDPDASAELAELLADMLAWFMEVVLDCAAAKEAMARTMMFLNCMFADLLMEN